MLLMTVHISEYPFMSLPQKSMFLATFNFLTWLKIENRNELSKDIVENSSKERELCEQCNKYGIK
jgi:hypothetical protein